MIRIAVLDLYEGMPNQGMRCIRQIIQDWKAFQGEEVYFQEFDVRSRMQLPDLSFDIYISSGGPGSPLDTKGMPWDTVWFEWLRGIEAWNTDLFNTHKKHVFFICHSFQLACRHFETGLISKRKSTSFGVYPVHVTAEGQEDPVFKGLGDPFYVVDSRDYQVIHPDFEKIYQHGSRILCIEKYRPHVPYEQAIMAIRFNEYMVGTQFHPEADAVGMSLHLQTEEKKRAVVEEHGEEKWERMVEQLNDPEKIMWTYAHVLPNFLSEAVKKRQPSLIGSHS